ncbi:MAG: PDZ domain-containing protein [Lactobacillaceae bacterium]|jgi:PDZ domain-containing protein|nr:PDZ domain-containing protein [Lactobacillaceae bacterium]
MNKNTNKLFYTLVVVSAIFLVTLIAWVIPINAYVETPGQATDIRKYLTVNGKKDKTKGNLRLVSVYLSDANIGDWIKSNFSPAYSIESKDEVTGGATDYEYEKISEYQMNNSIQNAEIQAFKLAGKSSEIKQNYHGIYIAQVMPNSEFKKLLKIGDTITKINGVHYTSSKDFQNALAKMSPGNKLNVTFVRNGETKTVTAKTVVLENTKTKENPKGRTGIGISLVDDTTLVTNPKVKVNIGEIGGPSGGMMFTLQLYSQLANIDLKKGRNISGTGTIESDGSIGEIGGIDKKILAAKKAGSTIFLTPYIKPTKSNVTLDGGKTNYQLAIETAKKYAPGIKIVPVETIRDAVNFLEKGTIIKVEK